MQINTIKNISKTSELKCSISSPTRTLELRIDADRALEQALEELHLPKTRGTFILPIVFCSHIITNMI